MSRLVPVPRFRSVYRLGQGEQSYGSERCRYVAFCYRLVASGSSVNYETHLTTSSLPYIAHLSLSSTTIPS